MPLLCNKIMYKYYIYKYRHIHVNVGVLGCMSSFNQKYAYYKSSRIYTVISWGILIYRIFKLYPVNVHVHAVAHMLVMFYV